MVHGLYLAIHDEAGRREAAELVGNAVREFAAERNIPMETDAGQIPVPLVTMDYWQMLGLLRSAWKQGPGLGEYIDQLEKVVSGAGMSLPRKLFDAVDFRPGEADG